MTTAVRGPRRSSGVEPRVFDRHAPRGERHRGAAAGVADLGGGEVVSRAEALHLAGDSAPEGGGVERLDGRDAALAFGQRAEELLAPETDGTDDADARDEHARRAALRRSLLDVHVVAYSAVRHIAGGNVSHTEFKGAKMASRARRCLRTPRVLARGRSRSRCRPRTGQPPVAPAASRPREGTKRQRCRSPGSSPRHCVGSREAARARHRARVRVREA